MTVIDNKISCYALPGVTIISSHEYIIETVKRKMNVSTEELCSRSRLKRVRFARQCCLYYMRKLTNSSLNEIGKTLNRDHATVIHSSRVIGNMILMRHGEFYTELQSLEQKLVFHE